MPFLCPSNKKGASIFKSNAQRLSKSERPLAPKHSRARDIVLPLRRWFVNQENLCSYVKNKKYYLTCIYYYSGIMLARQ